MNYAEVQDETIDAIKQIKHDTVLFDEIDLSFGVLKKCTSLNSSQMNIGFRKGRVVESSLTFKDFPVAQKIYLI